jgi:cytochrome b pre-mRNA-processing protein 3
MLALLKKNRALKQSARFLYGSIVTAARRRIFYAEWGAPDTVQGRFEMILMHVVLAQDRLAAEGEGGLRLARALSEAFVDDMDDCMREMTFGDLSVPREVRSATGALHDRWCAYRPLLGQERTAHERLAPVLADRFAYPGGKEVATARLAAYMHWVHRVIGAQPREEVLAGRFGWPNPCELPSSQEPSS